MKAERFSCRIYGVLPRPGAGGRVEVLLTRSLFSGREFVNFPGGGIELGEAPRDALAREFLEETGIAIEPVHILYASQAVHVSTQKPWQLVSMYWLVKQVGGTLRAGGNGDDVAATFWSELRDIPKSEMFPSDLEMLQALPGLPPFC
ncbi:MAG: NUDIX hydrolase [Elusimicrobiota bacterium]|jgi:ADP-ribose pyrophosphatase YjhB (NUDIX family)